MSSAAYDAIIIGAGQAGPPLAARLSAAGMSVAIVERKYFGGTCVNTGCIPTKALVASAYAARMVARAAEFGVVASGGAMDMKKVKGRKDAISLRSRTGIESWMQGLERCTVYRGQARFVSPTEVDVGGDRLTAPRVFINVGARASTPRLPGLDAIPHLTNSSMMEVDFLPEHLVIVGGSYVGLEFAQMYRRFGSRVTVIETGPRLLGREDEDVSEAIEAILAAEGIQVRCRATCIGFERSREGILTKVDCERGDPEVTGSHVLLAVGRTPNTGDLGLDAAGVRVDDRGYIVVDDALRTSTPGIWALGDCNGRGAFTHTSYNDFQVVAANVLDGEDRSVAQRIQAYAVYIDPPLGRAGMTEAEVRRSGRRVLVAKRPMTRVGRAVEKGETQGFMKAFVDADTGAILGAAILGTGGDEAIHSILDAMYAGATAGVLRRAMHIHPTVSELIPTLLEYLSPLTGVTGSDREP